MMLRLTKVAMGTDTDMDKAIMKRMISNVLIP